MVVHHDESVLERSDGAWLERAHQVRVQQTPDVRRFVHVGARVRKASSVGDGAVRARRARQVSDARGEVTRQAGKASEHPRRKVQPMVKVHGELTRGERVEV